MNMWLDNHSLLKYSLGVFTFQFHFHHAGEYPSQSVHGHQTASNISEGTASKYVETLCLRLRM